MYRPYVSLDIEPTGIGDEAEVLQISAVLDEPGKPLEELSTFDLLLKHRKFDYAEPYAMVLNTELLKIIAKGKDDRLVYPKQAIERFILQLDVWKNTILNYDEANGLGMKGKVMIAGKNVSGFDKPKMLACAERHSGKSLRQELNSKWLHRAIDVGPMYMTDFGYIPSLDQINEMTGRTEVTHNALDDAFDVVHAVRHKFKEL